MAHAMKTLSTSLAKNTYSKLSGKQKKMSRQYGAVLVVSLIMLLLLTLIGVTGMQTTSMEEKMAGNTRDRSIAFQAAESALRDAERDITHSRNLIGYTGFSVGCGGSTPSTGDDGLCYNGGTAYSTDIWTTVSMTAAPSVAYGQVTHATAISNLSAQPRYIIEGLPSGTDAYYRITVRAQGVLATTVVWLQAIYRQS